MRKLTALIKILFVCCVLLEAGCENNAGTAGNIFERSKSCICSRFRTSQIKIMPLTELTVAKDGVKTGIKAYVGLMDEFDSQQKWPVTIRFELYQQVPRSAEPKGKRVQAWPDFNLTEPEKNNQYWKDFLRIYEFNLELETIPDQNYILQVTCLFPDGRRLTAESPLKKTP
jgi:hypothetical protein